MKRLIAVASVATLCSAVSAFAGGNHGGSSSGFSGGGHRGGGSSAAAPAAAAPAGPRLSGNGAHIYSSRPTSYRPVTTYRNGNRTLNYPAVGASNVRRSTQSNLTNSNNARVIQRNAGNFQRSQTNLQRTGLQRNAGNLQSTTSNLSRTGGNLQRSGSGNPQHAGALNTNRKANRLDPQSSSRLRNWSGNPSSTAQAHQNHWNNCHHHHNHDWWHNHCLAFIFWDWGWWGWYDGWWYPAWGYDPYSYYGYNEPIYGYGDLSPEQIVASVQVALQEQGYYQYAIDGQMGPQTKEAIARYQRDHRLPITYGIDQPLLGALGIIH